jgi:hypothetical protein
MKTTSYSLVVVSPEGPRFHRFNVSRRVIIIVAAFILSFAITVALLTSFPPNHVSDDERTRLAAENQSLKIENKNTEISVSRLTNQLSQMEQKAQQLTDLWNTSAD